MLKQFLLLLFFVLLVGFIFSYNKEEFTASLNANLEFTTDTLSFDTVCTSLGSASKRFKVKNPNNQAVNISFEYLSGMEIPNMLNFWHLDRIFIFLMALEWVPGEK